MTTLIIGPSSVGKSTFMQRHNLRPTAAWWSTDNAAPELEPEDAAGGQRTIHYNLLHHAIGLYQAGRLSDDWPLLDDATLRNVIQGGSVTHAVVLVAPLEVIQERVRTRNFVEPGFGATQRYAKNSWHKIYQRVDLCKIYVRLVDLLDQAFIPFDVRLSSAQDTTFPKIDRASIHEVLNRRT